MVPVLCIGFWHGRDFRPTPTQRRGQLDEVQLFRSPIDPGLREGVGGGQKLLMADAEECFDVVLKWLRCNQVHYQRFALEEGQFFRPPTDPG